MEGRVEWEGGIRTRGGGRDQNKRGMEGSEPERVGGTRTEGGRIRAREGELEARDGGIKNKRGGDD